MNELVVKVDDVEYHSETAEPADEMSNERRKELVEDFTRQYPASQVQVHWRDEL